MVDHTSIDVLFINDTQTDIVVTISAQCDMHAWYKIDVLAAIP